jgi:HAD superfamily hydrolase (TIGR01490 family)
VGIAFFDLDLTVLDVNSVGPWVRSERRHGLVSRWQLVRALFALFRYRLGAVDMEPLIREAIGHHAGASESELIERSIAFYDAELAHRVRPGALKALETHRNRNHPCVLLTTSSQYIAQQCADRLGFDDAIGTRFKVDGEGVLTGAPMEPLCYGRGKVQLAEVWTRRTGQSLKDSTFYTDSISDLPMLDAVGTPVVINPDKVLARLARSRGWQAHDWGDGASVRPDGASVVS